MAELNHKIVLAARPDGMPKESDFRLVETERPEPRDGQFVARTHYLSVDPYMRGLMNGKGTYRAPIAIGEVIVGGTIGTVIASRHARFREGDIVVGQWGWQEFGLSDGEGVERVDPAQAPITTALGVLGMPGMTAYFGLLEIGRPQPGETVFVSGAAGAVGELVGQIAKIKGCHVAGSAGSDAKIDYLRNELGFDGAFNYKGVRNYTSQIRKVCPNGVDVYFDNVGGPLTDAVFTQINTGARIAICGQIDQYNMKRVPRGPRLLWHLLLKQARAEGFLVFQFADRYYQGREQMAEWIREGKLRYRETITDGLAAAPQAFIGLFAGANIGKQLVRVASE